MILSLETVFISAKNRNLESGVFISERLFSLKFSVVVSFFGSSSQSTIFIGFPKGLEGFLATADFSSVEEDLESVVFGNFANFLELPIFF